MIFVRPVLASLFLLSVSTVPAQLTVIGVEEGNTLDVRSEPSPKASIAGRLPSGAREIRALSSAEGPDEQLWLQIETGAVKGWVKGTSLTPLSDSKRVGDLPVLGPILILQLMGKGEDPTWIRVTGNKGFVGISSPSDLNPLFVRLPAAGEILQQGKACVEIEYASGIAELFAPMSGKVIRVNARLEKSPELLGRNFSDGGWLFELEFSDPAELKNLEAITGRQTKTILDRNKQATPTKRKRQ